MSESPRRYNLRKTKKKPQGVLLKRWEVEYSKVISNENRRIPLEKVKNAIRSAFEDGMFEQWRITLKCPLSGQRIKVPARYADCTHIECFDLEALLRMKTQKNLRVCPICQKEVEKPLANLRIDEYIETVLSTLPDAMQVELLHDGTFTEVHKEFIVVPNVINDEEPFVQDNNTSSFGIKHEASEDDDECITLSDGEDESVDDIVEMKPISLMPLNMDIKPKITSSSEPEQTHSKEDQEIQEALKDGREYITLSDGEDDSVEGIVEMKPISLMPLNIDIKPKIASSSEPEPAYPGESPEIQTASSTDRRRRRSSNCRSRSASPCHKRRSRTRSIFSRSPSPRESCKRLNIANLDDSVRLRDIDDAFSKFGKLSAVWVASSPPFYAIVVFEKSEDAFDALYEMRSGYVRNCHVRTTVALPHNSRMSPPRRNYDRSPCRSRPQRRRSRSPHKQRSSKRSRRYSRSSSSKPERTHTREDKETQDQQNSGTQKASLSRKNRIQMDNASGSLVGDPKKRVPLNDKQTAKRSVNVNTHSDQSSSEIYLSSDSSGDENEKSRTKENDRYRNPTTSTQVVLNVPELRVPAQKLKISKIRIDICYGTASFQTSDGKWHPNSPLCDYVSILRDTEAEVLGCLAHIVCKTPTVKIWDEADFRSKTVIGFQKKFKQFSEDVHSVSHLWENGRIYVDLFQYSDNARIFLSLQDFCEALFGQERSILKCKILEIDWFDEWWPFLVITNVAHHCEQLIFKIQKHPSQKLHHTFLDILYTVSLPRHVDVTLDLNYSGYEYEFINKLEKRFQRFTAKYFKFKLLSAGFPQNKLLRNYYGTLEMKKVDSNRYDNGLIFDTVRIKQRPHKSVPDQHST